jgi:predicted negative regulator of RcsB-dependent stress response
MEEAGVAVGMLRGRARAMRGDFEAARRSYAEWRQGQLERGHLVEAYGQGSAAGYFELLAGDLDRAEEILRESWEGLGAMGERGFRSTVGGELGELLAGRGRLDEAEAILDEAEAISTPDDWVTVSQVTTGRALVASGRGEHEGAVALARAAVDLVDAHEYLTMQQTRWSAYGDVLLAAGRTAEARSAFEHARSLAQRKQATFVVDLLDARLAALASTL